MDWIVTTARTVEEAQTRALDLLGVDSADAEIQVIEEGKTGLFGRTKSEARVRARIKPKAPATKDERRPGRNDRNRSRNKGGGGRGDRQGGNNRGSRGSGKSAKNGDSASSGNRGGRGSNKSSNDNDSSSKGKRSNDSGSKSGSGGRSSNKGDGGGRNRNRGGGSGGDKRQRSDRGGKSGGNEDRVEMPIEEQRETLETFVKGVATAFDPDASVTLVEEGTTLQAQVTGPDLGRLVGAKAATLQALEELSRTAMHRAASGRRYHRIQVDVDNYRGRRREALVKFATDLARQVAESGESKAMEPMGAADRKLIHDAVSEVDGVETVSEGRDPRRYIVLLATDTNDEEE